MILKKGISPVVATALLIVVSVIAVVGFQQWYSSFESGLLTNTEKKSSSNIANINIESISNDGILYISNKGDLNISIEDIKISYDDCNLSYVLEPGINKINVVSCLNVTGENNIVLIIDDGIIEEKVYLDEIYFSCSLDSNNDLHGESSIFYNVTLVPFGNSCVPLLRECDDGVYLGDSSFEYSSCSVTAQDTLPNAFSFTDQINVASNTLISSNILTPTGYEGPLSVNVSGSGSPQLRVDSGSWTTSTTMNPGQTLQLRLTSSSSGLTSLSANLDLGDHSDTWSVTTITSSLSCVIDGDSDTYFSNACAVYPMSYVTFEGHLDADDSSSTVIADPKCWLKSDKSSCETNFIVNGCGAGTVLDIGTGLCWQRDWSTAGTLTWANALTYCNNLVLGGHSDWVLPSKQQMSSLKDTSRSNPAIVGGNNNKFINIVNFYYSTTNTAKDMVGGNGAIVVDVRSGYEYGRAKSDSYDVACVRFN